VSKQLLLAIGAVVAISLLFFFGKTVSKKTTAPNTVGQNTTTSSFKITDFITAAKQKLTAQQVLTLGKLENSVTRGDVLNQEITASYNLANFWKDSAKVFEPYIYYLSKAVKLEKSEKNLTFAAQLMLDNLRSEQDEVKLDWKTAQAVELFEQAIELNPNNEDLKIGLGSSYIFGKGRTGQPEQTMKGIQALLSVVRKDSTNMKAQLVLGIGGFLSTQYDKAIERLTKVVQAEPNNIEAIAYLADAYAAHGENQNAIKWYLVMKKLAINANYNKEIDERIKQLQ
jgi:tetratricopeptide (TPR) repeat protein